MTQEDKETLLITFYEDLWNDFMNQLTINMFVNMIVNMPNGMQYFNDYVNMWMEKTKFDFRKRLKEMYADYDKNNPDPEMIPIYTFVRQFLLGYKSTCARIIEIAKRIEQTNDNKPSIITLPKNNNN